MKRIPTLNFLDANFFVETLHRQTFIAYNFVHFGSDILGLTIMFFSETFCYGILVNPYSRWFTSRRPTRMWGWPWGSLAWSNLFDFYHLDKIVINLLKKYNNQVMDPRLGWN